MEIFRTQLLSVHTLSLIHGDLTDEATDAIVNAANSGLVHGGGIAGAIVRKGGQVIQDESDRVGRVRTGEAAITGAGNLKAKYVIHAVGPHWRGQSPEESDRLLASAVMTSLELAREKELSSIAIPAISSGIFGFPKDRCATVIVAAICDWAEAHSSSSPRTLRITVLDAATLAHFRSALENRFGQSA